MCNFECIAKMRDIFEEKLIFCGKEFRTSSNKNYSYVAINLTFSPFVAKKKKSLILRFSSHQAQAALMYDAVFVLVEAFNKFLRKKPDRSNVRRTGIPGSSQITNGTRALDCNSSRGWVTPFEYGDKISRLLRKVSETHLSFFLRERLKKRKKKKCLKIDVASFQQF